MKRCPSCQKAYSDDLSRCADDASSLDDVGVRVCADLLRRAEPLEVSRAVRLDARYVEGRPLLPVHPLDVEVVVADGVEDVRVDFAAKRGDFEGTAPYASPEVLAREPPTPASVVYNAAVILLRVAHGAHALRGIGARSPGTPWGDDRRAGAVIASAFL